MPLSQQQIDAYANMEVAIKQIADAFEFEREGEILSGWVLMVNGVKFETDCDNKYHDEQSVDSVYSYFVRRGQQYVLTRGIIEATLDKMRET